MCIQTHSHRNYTHPYTHHTHTQSRGCSIKSSESGGATVKIKVLIVAFSYIIVGLVATTSFAISSSRHERLKEEVFAYFHCESCGINQQSGENCSRSRFEQLTNVALVTMAYSLFGLHSLITLVYVIRMSDLKVCCGTIRKRLRGLTRGTTVTTTSQDQMASDGMSVNFSLL